MNTRRNEGTVGVSVGGCSDLSASGLVTPITIAMEHLGSPAPVRGGAVGHFTAQRLSHTT